MRRKNRINTLYRINHCLERFQLILIVFKVMPDDDTELKTLLYSGERVNPTVGRLK